MEKIEIHYRPVVKQIAYHKYFVYSRSAVAPLAMRSGPDLSANKVDQEQAIRLLEQGMNPFPNLRSYMGCYAEGWIDYPSGSPPHHAELLLQGDNLAPQWLMLQQAMAVVNREDYQYHPTLQSSNTLTDHVLNQIGYPPLRHGGWGNYWAPGSNLPMQPGRVEGTALSHTVPEQMIAMFRMNLALSSKREVATGFEPYQSMRADTLIK